MLYPSPPPPLLSSIYHLSLITLALALGACSLAPVSDPVTPPRALQTFTVSFNTDGGSVVSNQRITEGKKAVKPSPEPKRVGHTFAGWFTTAATNTGFNFDSAIGADTIVYAAWKRNGYVVTFNTDGGSEVAAQVVLYTNKATRPAAPKKVGHIFAGWFTTAATNTGFNFDSAIGADTVVYAAWKRNSYTVTFNTDGGSEVAAQAVLYTNKATRPAAPKKVGHTFAGWFTTEATNIPFNFTAPITNAITAYAAWKRNSYTVTFNTDGGGAVASQRVEYGGSAVRPPNPTRGGKFFTGWFTTAAINTVFNFDTARITSNTAVYAGWGDTGVMVTFNTGGGSSVAEQRLASGEIATRPANPTSNGYAFLGWYFTSTALTAATPTFNFVTKITSNTTLYAGWIQTFTVEFVTNQGGDRVVWQSQTIRQGSNAAAPAAAPVWEGRIFKGWFTTAATNTPFNFNAALNVNTTVYAAWQLKRYEVAFNLNGGAGNLASQSVKHGSNAVRPTAEPTRVAHNFLGWYDRTLTSAFNFASGVKSATTLYAKWELKTYTVSFTNEGGAAFTNQRVRHGSRAVKPTDPEREWYVLRGWYWERTLNTAFNFSQPITNDTVVYPKWTEVQQLLASDREAGDRLGSSVALSGNTLVVGAYYQDSKAGAVYVFTRSSSSSTNWRQRAKLVASDRAGGDQFGRSVALDGNTLVVGANKRASGVGAVYVFTNEGVETWHQQARLLCYNSWNERCGYSVALEENTLVAGARGWTGSTGQFTGAAHVFARSGTSWSSQAVLQASDPQFIANFGYSVALSKGTIAVGAYNRNPDGAVYVYTNNGAGTWRQQVKLTPNDATATGDVDWFGRSVALEGNTLVVGSRRRFSSYNQAGGAYVFTRSGGVWSQEALLLASDRRAYSYFGETSAISGDTVVVGAFNHVNGTGAAYVFSRSSEGWSQKAQLLASDPLGPDNFGSSVALEGDTIAVGAYLKDSGGKNDTGAAYLFKK